MGGHEHTNNMEKVGSTIIAKADANAKTVYVHSLIFDIHNKLTGIRSELVNVDESVEEDPAAKLIVNEWVEKAYKGFKDKGFDPAKVVAILTEPLDGIDESTRYMQTNLGHVIASAMLAAAPDCEIAVFNSGSIRLDDKLMGEVTQYDIIRTLPFGGKIMDVELKGTLLLKLLETGRKNAGSGGYLQYANISFDSVTGKWNIGNKTLDESLTYKAAIAAYLLTGLEQNMSFFTKDNPEIIKITDPDASNANDLKNDIRLAIISYLEKGGR
jgi:2',3'-cyclic-nucleotide 2'-phosphodiesterase (5'-nucleotidase family)